MPTTAPAGGGFTTGEVARRLGIPVWAVRRIYERGLLPPPPRVGQYRFVPAEDVDRLEGLLIKAGYLKEAGR
jgi:DNA-binding transcriptional MerR regulator